LMFLFHFSCGMFSHIFTYFSSLPSFLFKPCFTYFPWFFLFHLVWFVFLLCGYVPRALFFIYIVMICFISANFLSQILHFFLQLVVLSCFSCIQLLGLHDLHILVLILIEVVIHFWRVYIFSTWSIFDPLVPCFISRALQFPLTLPIF
jgi:hypothetical protein